MGKVHRPMRTSVELVWLANGDVGLSLTGAVQHRQRLAAPADVPGAVEAVRERVGPAASLPAYGAAWERTETGLRCEVLWAGLGFSP